MPGAEPEGGVAAGIKAPSKKNRRQSLRRSFDSITAEKSKSLYHNADMYTMKDSHIHSVTEALLESERLLKENKQDPDRHAKMVAEFRSFKEHKIVAPPAAQQGARDLAPGRRMSVVPAAKSSKRLSQRRSFDGVPSRIS